MFYYPNGAALVSVNGTDISQFLAKLNSDYEISGPEIDLETWQGRNRSTLLLLGQSYGLLTIKLPIDFWSPSKIETMSQITLFNQSISGEFELDLSDGFQYTCVASEIGAPQWINDDFCTVDYEFKGIRHKELVSNTFESGSANLTIESTFPRTDCRITIPTFYLKDGTSGGFEIIDYNSGSRKKIMEYWFNGEDGLYTTKGPLVVDGFKKTVTFNGEALPNIPDVFEDFPYLVPGKNIIEVYSDGVYWTAPVTLEYYPTFL